MLSDEFSLIQKIQKKIGRPKRDLVVGIGDDTAVFRPPKGKILSTVDCLMEDVHFSLKFFKPAEIGHKALAVNLSDIAAMGGEPRYALVSLGLRKGITDKFILDFYEGLLKLARLYGVQVIGGNLTRSHCFFADITVIGEAKRPMLRAGAKPGDLLGITGVLGLASAGLQALLRGKTERHYPELIQRQKMPQPQILAGIAFSNCKAAHSLIDISDGLSSELNHLSAKSNVVIEIDASKIPLARELKDFCRRVKTDPMDYIWNGGEDYELIGVFDPSGESVLKKHFHVIGKVAGRGKGVFANLNRKRERIVPHGWNHFEN